MIVRRATEADGTSEALVALVRSGLGHDRHIDQAKLRGFVKSFCAVQGDACGMLGEENGVLVAVAAGMVLEHPWLIGKQLQVIALTGPGGRQCLAQLQKWARERGAGGEFLTLNPDKRYDRWARGEGLVPIRSYWRPSWQ